MNPRLVAVDGPLEGETYPIVAGELSIGRNPGSGILIPDESVSRRHCSIVGDDAGRVLIRDSDSRNGTFVNGLPIQERELQHLDEVRLGNCRFVLLAHQEDEASHPSAVLSGEMALLTRTMVQLRRDKAVYLNPEEALESSAPPARLAQGLKALLKVSTMVRATRGVKALAGNLMEVVFEAVPAFEGAIVLFEPGLAEPLWTFGWTREAGAAGTVNVPGDLVRRACEEDIAILSNELPGDAALGTPGSLLAAPLPGADGVLGVLYLASTDPRVEFDEEHLQLVTAIASASGLALENAVTCDRLNAENRRLRQEIDLEHDMVGESPRMEEVYRFIAKAAPTEATVLIFGESGTGKELAARALHRNSPRAARPFVAINCAALTESLLESELFGHERGSFTGAVAQKKGKFEVADGGTVFLDEIGEIPPALQVKLLRAIQEREFDRVGGTRPVKVDVRVVAATNRDLRAAVKEGAFREDLYYRLNVVALQMPALRERRVDIPLLATFFADKHARRAGRKTAGFSADARACLMSYDWPGNVRELGNAIERAIVLGSADRILPEDLPEVVLETAPPDAADTGNFHEAVRREKQRIIARAIEETGGSQTGAAKLLGINPTYLSRLIRNLGLKTDGKQASRS